MTAHFSDGHTEDYTHQALYTVNDGEVASVSASGVVSAKRRGETSILVRAAGQVASVGVGVIGPPVPDYPKIARDNFIDDTFSKSCASSRSFRPSSRAMPNSCAASASISPARCRRPSASANSSPAPIRGNAKR